MRATSRAAKDTCEASRYDLHARRCRSCRRAYAKREIGVESAVPEEPSGRHRRSLGLGRVSGAAVERHLNCSIRAGDVDQISRCLLAPATDTAG